MASIKRHEKDDGTPFWRVRWREGAKGRGGRPRQKDHTVYGIAKAHLKEAQDIEARRSGRVAGGDGRWTVARFFEDKFLPGKGNRVTAGTVAGYRRRWAPAPVLPTDSPKRAARKTLQPWHLQRAWGDWPLEDITFEAIEDWHTQMRRRGATAATMYRAHDLLVDILNYAVRLRYIAANEALGNRPTYQPKRVVGVWRPEDVETIRAVFEDKAANGRRDFRWARDRDGVLVAVLAYAGLRPGEALALTWRNVLDGHLWITHTIPGVDDVGRDGIELGRTKTGRERNVPLTPFLRTILRDWRMRMGRRVSDDTPVFPTQQHSDAVWTRRAWNNWRGRVWMPTLERAGVTYKRPYHLRHSCLTLWIYAGVPVPEVARRGGHTVETLLGNYLHAIETYDADHPVDVAGEFAAARAPAAPVRLRAVG